MNSFVGGKILLAAALGGLLIPACGQDYNSNSGDDVYQESGPIGDGSPGGEAFAAAFGVIKAQCLSCHTNYHADWAKLTSEADWKSSGNVTPQNSASSSIITILINNGGNMPKDGKALSAQDYAKLTSWIDGMQ